MEPGFIAPVRLVKDENDMRVFVNSRTAARLLSFIQALNTSVRGVKLSDECFVSPLVKRLLNALSTVEEWVHEYPPSIQQMRYGNLSFRAWHERLLSSAADLLKEVLPEEKYGAIVELAPYFCESFGNAARIDYGTGHENTFVAFLLCLYELGLVGLDDQKALVTRVFAKYISVMRRLQISYRLEPAGSHGVWGLDDYFFLPFYWGASQLIQHDVIKPNSIHVDNILELFADEYLYISSVAFVKEVKKGHLSETSPMLNDISGVMNWEKVNSGLFKMYKAECMGKFPIMQHFLFGSILSLR